MKTTRQIARELKTLCKKHENNETITIIRTTQTIEKIPEYIPWIVKKTINNKTTFTI